MQAALRLALRSATDSCYLSSPYFLPPRNIKVRLLLYAIPSAAGANTHARTHVRTHQRAIIRAARNGSDVRIITAGDSDIPFIRYSIALRARLGE